MTVPPLDAFPRPNVAVDLVLLTVGSRPGRDERQPTLGVVVLRRADGQAVLPGRFIRERQTIKQTVDALLEEKLGYAPRHRLPLTMLNVYDDPARDERGWVFSVGYASVLTPEETAGISVAGMDVLPVHGDASRGRHVTRERLAYDHDEMVTTAVRRARRSYERSPDPLGLIHPPYTLSQLRHVHEAVLDAALKRDTFNRRMMPFLEPALDSRGAEMFTSETVGRPAQLYRPRRIPHRDPEAGPFPLPRSQR